MRRISTPTAAQDLFGPGKHGFRNGDPAKAILATRLAAEWFNALQEEVCSVVEQAGFPLDSGNNSQLAAAIVQLIRSNTIDTLNTQRIDIASAATINLTTSAPNTRHINITGTTAITGFTVAAGRCYFVRFAGALTLTNGASLVTQTGGNIVTAAGDTCILRATAANVVEVLSYMPTAMLDSTRIDVASAAAVNLTTLAPNTRHINITGTTTITSFTVAAGRCYFVRFAASLTLTNSASLVTQTGGNIVTAAGDTCILRATAANVVEVLAYSAIPATSSDVIAGADSLRPVTSAALEAARPKKTQASAWVNFNGGGTVAIRDSHNVSSVTDNGVGLYTINFAAAMANANYAFSLNSDNSGDNLPNLKAISTNPPTAAALPIRTTDNSNVARDYSIISATIFGGN